jgi:hypothetical protein
MALNEQQLDHAMKLVRDICDCTSLYTVDVVTGRSQQDNDIYKAAESEFVSRWLAVRDYLKNLP